MTAYILGHYFIWQIFDNEGFPASNGFLIPRNADNPNEWKLVYRNDAGTDPFPMDSQGRVRLNDLGQIGPVYFADDAPYWLQFQTQTGQLINEILAYTPPSGGTSPPVTQQIDTYNHISNPQFYFPYEIPATLGTNKIPLCPGGLFFQKSNANAGDTIEATTFLLGQEDVPAQPINAFTYTCTSVGAGGEVFKDFHWPLGRVFGFQNTSVSFGAYLISSTTSTVQFIFRQYFGTGGSPSATVNSALLTFDCENTWSQASDTYAIPSVAGKTLGTNGDDQCYLILRMPLNQISQVSFANIQFVHYVTLPNFEFQNEEYIFNNTIPLPANDGSDAGKALTLDSTGYRKEWIVPGFVSQVAYLTVPRDEVTEDEGEYRGWLLADVTPRILNIADYPALFAKTGNRYGGDGITTFALIAGAGHILMGECSASGGISAWAAGQLTGEEKHAQTEDELAGHGHAQRINNGTDNSQQAVYAKKSGGTRLSYGIYPASSSSDIRIVTDDTGLGTPMNIMQPTAVLGAVLVKY